VGVTGHRLARLEGVDLDALAKRVRDVLAAIDTAAPGTAFRLVGSLADGADVIAAEAALARGWQVDAVLPFKREDYVADFVPAGAADELRRHLSVVTSSFELPGRRDEPGGAAAAYERAGRVVMAQSDILLAIWDGDPPAGRGGAAQMVAEAVALGLPVVVVDPRSVRSPAVLWGGLNEHGLGPEAIDSVARGDLSTLPRILAETGPDATRRANASAPRLAARVVSPPLRLAYPLLLALTGVRQPRRSDLVAPRPAAARRSPAQGFEGRMSELLEPRFARADADASGAAQLFRGAFVSNFALAALAVSLSLASLALPSVAKPVLALGEFGAIAAILLITRAGARSGWHARWLESRRLAERLRCLDLSARLGDLMLREDGGVAGEERLVGRALGLPDGVADGPYLAAVHARLIALLDNQIEYLTRDAARMHRLEHRLHRAGGALFVTVATVCAGVFLLEAAGTLSHDVGEIAHHIPIGVSLLSAALPAIGAAIYGIRMQGDFAGTAERNTELVAQLRGLRQIAGDDAPSFDTLLRLVRRTTELLGQDVGQWYRASRARPLALPG
jgi:hypothetical protein